MKLDTRMIEKRIVSYYLNSRDYNGLSLSTLIRDIETNSNNIYEIVIELVKTGKISVASPHQSNPFIKMFDAPIEEQLDGLKERNPRFVCLYPTPTSVQEEIALSGYDDQPFTKMMVLANPKLLAIPFRLDVLDIYERDLSAIVRGLHLHAAEAQEPTASLNPLTGDYAYVRSATLWPARRDSNPRPSVPKTDALSTELRAGGRAASDCTTPRSPCSPDRLFLSPIYGGTG